MAGPRSPEEAKEVTSGTKKGEMIYTVPFHKGKEIGNDLAKAILKDLGIKR